MTDLRIYPERDRVLPERARDFAAELNAEQAAAATHGDGPLLIIAGAGTGKTRTLVHRVAHLIDRGVRPERILLLTFTRRAAQEMLDRAERLVGGSSSRVQGGTFHGTGHRFLRRFGPAAGLPRDFTIMDQGTPRTSSSSRAPPSATANKKSVSRRKKRFTTSTRGTSTPSIPSPTSSATSTRSSSDYHRGLQAHLRRLHRRGRPKRNLVDYDDLLLSWALMLEASPELADADRRPLRPRARRRVPGHEPAAGAHPPRHVPPHTQHHGRRRRRAEHLLVPRRELPQHPRLPAAVPGHDDRHARAELPLDAAHPRLTNTLISRAHERYTKKLWTEARRRRTAVARDGAGRAAADALRRRPHSRAARGRHAAARDRRARSRRLHVRRSRDRAHEPEDSRSRSGAASSSSRPRT